MSADTHYTKLFLTIFGAILAAAAVIFGVWSCRASMEKAAAADLSALETYANTASLAGEMAVKYGKVEERLLDEYPWMAERFEKILRAGRVDRMKARSLTSDFVFDFGEVVKFVREKMPERREWANEMDALLSRVEAAAQSS